MRLDRPDRSFSLFVAKMTEPILPPHAKEISMDTKRSITQTSRLGDWLPWDVPALNRWLEQKIDAAEKSRKKTHPVIAEFRQLIESDPVMFMYFTQMFEQQPSFPPPPGSGDVKLRDYQQMLTVMNHILTTAPEYDETSLVGFPINAILDFPMITPAGLAAFVDPRVNAMLKKVLKAWATFLDSPESLEVLNDSPKGWMSPAAQKAMNIEEFVIDKKKPHWGFKSWNDFFIRRFKPGKRPVADPGDARVIVSACESGPFSIQTGIKSRDTFWIKGQPYSLQHMLDGHHVDDFVGGTVYQAFLSALNYHRWHSPIDGVVKETYSIEGTYYAEAASEGFDPAGPNNSQGYIAHTAARALIFIESDRPELGLVCAVMIGMAEVSSNIITVSAGQKVKKGDQIGYFQYGGSTHCLIFKEGAIAEFALQAIPQGPYGTKSSIVPLNSRVALAN
jgi:phosphatidylserine decarboxylase